MFDYPYTGFHFLVLFELFPQLPNDFRFQEVSGLSVNVDLETYKEGGENRFVHRLPGRTQYSDLVLKRGFTLVSGVTAWCIDAVENYNYNPCNLIVSLLDSNHLPVSSWYVVNAIPIKYDISSFNAEQSQIVIESLTLRYEYYKTLSLSSAAAMVADLLNGPGAPSVSISFP
ncbi:MAG TPA: phage tail protein [Bacteroidia bacterium]|jgi:phage tail-like protein|nr:phage tail protein [Bacteroidia bacterium]